MQGTYEGTSEAAYGIALLTIKDDRITNTEVFRWENTEATQVGLCVCNANMQRASWWKRIKVGSDRWDCPAVVALIYNVWY